MSTCKGKITQVGEIKTGKKEEREWASQQFVVEEDAERYPEHWAMDIFGQDKIDEWNVQVGDSVEVGYDSRVTAKDGKFYASNRPYKVTKV